jgi:DNA-binding transcriptional LysR family regulator
MNLRFLEAFVWVVKLGSFRAAAERLNLTQAAVSSRIATLEEDFGQKLFDRDPRELRLTASGRLLLGYAERMLDLGRDMRAAMNSSRELKGVLRIGVVETVIHTWLTDFLAALSERHAVLEVQLTADSTLRLHDDMRRGLIDIAVQTDPVLHEGISNRDIGSMQLGWVGLPEDCRAGGQPLSINELVSRPIVTMTRGSQPHRTLLEACRRARRHPDDRALRRLDRRDRAPDPRRFRHCHPARWRPFTASWQPVRWQRFPPRSISGRCGSWSAIARTRQAMLPKAWQRSSPRRRCALPLPSAPASRVPLE